MVASKNLKLEAFWSSAKKLLVLVLSEIGILILIIFLLETEILDLKTIISVGLLELGLAILLYFLLGENKRGREEEIINLSEAVEKFSHLVAYTFPVWFGIRFNYYFYFIENTYTNKYYRAPKYIEHLVDEGIIQEIECKNEEEMKTLLAKKGCQPTDKKALLIDLLVVPNQARKSSVKR